MLKRFLLTLAVITVLFSNLAYAQRAPMPYVKIQFFDRNGKPCAACKLYTYVAGTTTPTTTYVSSSGAANTNPVIADSAGRMNVWMSGSVSYKFILKDSNDVQIWSVDNVTDYGAYLSAGGSVFAGDVSGAYDSTTVEKIQGVAVASTTPTDGQVMIYDTNQWTPGAVDMADTDAVTGILASNNGGTGNGFTKFSGAASSEKTFTLPNASATILTTNAVVTGAQGGTGSAYFTVAGPSAARTYTFPDADSTIPRVLTGSAALNFADRATLTSEDLTIAVSGAAVGDTVALGTPAAPNANTCYTAFVSATNVVTVRFNNYSGGNINPDEGTFKVTVFK